MIWAWLMRFWFSSRCECECPLGIGSAVWGDDGYDQLGRYNPAADKSKPFEPYVLEAPITVKPLTVRVHRTVT